MNTIAVITRSLAIRRFRPYLRWSRVVLLALGLNLFDVTQGYADVRSNPVPAAARFDFDGDRRADLTVFRPADGTWYTLNSGSGTARVTRFGLNGDLPVPEDYDGDGKYDIAVYRAGTWYRLLSLTNTFSALNFGVSTDVPTSGDFDGDQKADVAVYRPSEGVWYRQGTINSSMTAIRFGTDGDVPAVGDYDGDGKADINLFRPSGGVWYRLSSLDNGLSMVRFGASGDRAVVGDFDGDGKIDTGVWRPSNGVWYIQRSTDATYLIAAFGLPTDIPTAADYDGDGKTDIAVFRPSDGVWHRINSSNGSYTAQGWGVAGDIPIAAGNNPPPPAPPAFVCDYYASPTGVPSAAGTLTSPWDLQTALNKTTLIRNGKTLCLRGGTYAGKYTSTLVSGGIVRSAPGEWAKIDGNRTTTLTAPINSTQTTLTVASSAGMVEGTWFGIDTEIIYVVGVSGSTLTVLRNWSGTIGGPASHSNGAAVRFAGNQLVVSGSNTTYRDFEVTNSYTQRDLEPGTLAGQGCCGYYSALRGAGISSPGGIGNKYINLIVHDNLDGFFIGSSSSNTTIYGCLIFNNGGYYYDSGESRETGSGNGMYLENSSGFSRVYRNISINNFNFNGQFYGVTGPYVGGDLQYNVFANAGSPLGGVTTPTFRNFNVLYGPDSQVSPTANISNNHFWAPFNAYGGTPAALGYGAGINSATVTGNYFVGGPVAVSLANINTIAFSGNTVYGGASAANYVSVSTPLLGTWNNNIYPAAAGRSVYDSLSFATWRASTGFDAQSNETANPLANTAVVIPNEQQPGRGTIVVHSSSSPTSIGADLSSLGLTNGQSYAIKNAFNYAGPNVLTGNYNSGAPTVTIPLNGAAATVAAPTGMGFIPGTTCPQLCVMIVVPQ
jgi:hypothetical protein